MARDWKNWSPFQSPEVRAICENMTPDERNTSMRMGGFYGVWVAATLQVPLMVGVMSFVRGWWMPWLPLLAGGLVVVHLACIAPFRRRMRVFLCSTAWAKSRGFDPETLRAFSLRQGKLLLPLRDGLE
ncbi:hypothetical protein EP7_004504 [Isosphaeraceae bacterium EP7]